MGCEGLHYCPNCDNSFDMNQLAVKLVDWLSDQKYQDEPLLHAIVCCDFVSRQHFIEAVAKVLEGK